MSLKKGSLAAGVDKATARQDKVRPEKVYNAGATPGRRGKRGLTIYIDPAAHRVLKDLAEREDKKLQDLIFEGVNLMLQSYGEKPIA